MRRAPKWSWDRCITTLKISFSIVLLNVLFRNVLLSVLTLSNSQAVFLQLGAVLSPSSHVDMSADRFERQDSE